MDRTYKWVLHKKVRQIWNLSWLDNDDARSICQIEKWITKQEGGFGAGDERSQTRLYERRRQLVNKISLMHSAYEGETRNWQRRETTVAQLSDVDLPDAWPRLTWCCIYSGFLSRSSHPLGVAVQLSVSHVYLLTQGHPQPLSHSALTLPCVHKTHITLTHQHISIQCWKPP